MGILDTFRKSREKVQEKGTPPPRGLTLAEILQDKKNSHLFGRLLELDGHQELAVRLAEGAPTEEDIHLLEEQRLKFAEKIEKSEKIEKLLTEETVIEIARNHPDFEKIVNLVGPKKAIKAIQSQLKEICITDEHRFNTIADPIEALDSYKNGEYKKNNDEVEKLCKDMGVSQKEYLDALAIEDPYEKSEALWKLAKGKHTKFQDFINYMGGKTSKNFIGLQNSESLLESSVVELDRYKEDIGDVLYLSISGNDDMRNALSRELLSESATVAEPRDGFIDAKKGTGRVVLDEKRFSADWESYKRKMDYDKSAITDDQKDYVKDLFLDDQKEAYRKKGPIGKGFWHSVFATLFEKNISNKKSTLK